MTFQQKLLIPALALFFAVQASAAPILVGEFKPESAGDADEHVAIRTAIDVYNATYNPDLSQLFGAGLTPVLINEWEVIQAVTVLPTACRISQSGAEGRARMFQIPV